MSSRMPAEFSAPGRTVLFKVRREIKPVYSFEAACKCHKQSSVKIRKETLFLCRILQITNQDNDSPGLQIITKQGLRGERSWYEVMQTSCKLSGRVCRMVLTEAQGLLALCILQTEDLYQKGTLPGVLAEIDAQDHLDLLPLGCTFHSCLGLWALTVIVYPPVPVRAGVRLPV